MLLGREAFGNGPVIRVVAVQGEAPGEAAAAGDRRRDKVRSFALGQEDIRPPGIEESQGCVHILAKAASGWRFEDLNSALPHGQL